VRRHVDLGARRLPLQEGCGIQVSCLIKAEETIVGLQYGAGAPIPQLDPQLRHTDPRSKKVGERVIPGILQHPCKSARRQPKEPLTLIEQDQTIRQGHALLILSAHALSFCSAPTPRCHSLKDPIGTGRRQLILSAPGKSNCR
jgi:hypothetical protein